jgi:7-cyano-7-deazaguanine tRNA-ribosyltransferase
MIVVAGLSLKNRKPRVWDPACTFHLPDLKAIMVSYADFHRNPTARREAMEQGLRSYLGAPVGVKVYLDNGAFYLITSGGTLPTREYTQFVRHAKPDWYAIPRDYIPTPGMPSKAQSDCFTRTMRMNLAYRNDGFVPVIHVSPITDRYVAAFQRHDELREKKALALGGLVPNLLRAPKARPHHEILASLGRIRNEFPNKSLHVFGIGGTATLHLAVLLRMDSADSSGWRNRAARGIIQLPGSGDRIVADLGNWRGRRPSKAERQELSECICPACSREGLRGLRQDGIRGFCNRATHNLWVLLEELKWIQDQLAEGTYRANCAARLDNSIYKRLIDELLSCHDTPPRDTLPDRAATREQL